MVSCMRAAGRWRENNTYKQIQGSLGAVLLFLCVLLNPEDNTKLLKPF